MNYQSEGRKNISALLARQEKQLYVCLGRVYSYKQTWSCFLYSAVSAEKDFSTSFQLAVGERQIHLRFSNGDDIHNIKIKEPCSILNKVPFEKRQKDFLSKQKRKAKDLLAKPKKQDRGWWICLQIYRHGIALK